MPPSSRPRPISATRRADSRTADTLTVQVVALQP